LRAKALSRALLKLLALGAAALMAAAIATPSRADDLTLAYVTPAELTPQLAASRTAPPVTGLRPSFAVQPQLTNDLLASYVAKQQAVKLQLDNFNVAPQPELTEQVLLGYIDRTHGQNLALDAINSIASAPALNDKLLQSWATSKFVPTVKKVQFSNSEKLCLTEAIYHEARGEPDTGQWAVANVIINRAMSHKFPTTMCGVVYQNADQGYLRCQFTFACDGKSDLGTEQGAWAKASKMASAAYHEFQSGERPGVVPSDALYYHTLSVDPGWNLRRVAVIGAHEFYAD
jgi:hypothetical protein